MKKILIVEDDDAIRQALTDSLTTTYTVVTAEDGQQGLDVALREHPDLVLLDYFMPIKSGLEFVNELREDTWGKTAKIVFLTNNADIQTLNTALESTVSDYVLKSDLSFDALQELVKRKLAE